MTRMDIMKNDQRKRKDREKNHRNHRRKCPRIEGHEFPEWKGPRSTRNSQWWIPAPGHIIVKLQTTRDRESIFKLPVRERRETKPTKQGFVEKVWTTTPPGHLQIPGSTTRPSKLWGKIISNLGLDYTSKLSNKFVGKIKSFRYFLGCKMWAKKWDGMGASPGGE